MVKIDFYKIKKTGKVAIFNAIAIEKGVIAFLKEKKLVDKLNFEIHFFKCQIQNTIKTHNF